MNLKLNRIGTKKLSEAAKIMSYHPHPPPNSLFWVKSDSEHGVILTTRSLSHTIVAKRDDTALNE